MAVTNGTKGNDTIFVDAGNDTIKAGNGDDYIWAGSGNDVITGGKGANIIDFNPVTLPIPNYVPQMGHDVVNLTSGETLTLDCSSYETVKSATVVGKDLVLTFNENDSITLKNMASKDVVGSKGSVSLLLKSTDKENPIDLKDFVYNATAQISSKGVYSGKWVDEVIDASNYIVKDKQGNEVSTNTKGVNIKGNNGDDKITGSKYNDTLNGGNDNDIITGGAGADTITGGAGKNTIIHHNGDGNDVINLTKGEEFLLKVDNIQEIKIADNKKDVLVYTSETEYITIKNLAAKDVTNDATKKKEDESSVLLQVAGQDTPIDLRNYMNDWYPGYYVEANKNYTGTWLGEQIEAVSLNGKGLSINAGKGNDHIYGTEYSDTLKGGDGDDMIWTYGGKDKVYGGNGDDYLISNAGDTLPAGTELEASTLYGDKGNDTIEIWNTGDVAYGGDGDDIITVNNNNSKTAYGGKGNDEIRIGSGGATVYGEAGNDIIDGGSIAASNIVFAKGAGHDTYRNDGAADVLVFDKLATTNLSFEQNDKDLVISYGKNESVTVKNYTDDMPVYVQTKDDSKVLLSELYAAYKDETIYTSKSEKITAENDVVFAGAGNDQITVVDDSTVYAGNGNDTVVIEAGVNKIDTGNGKNTVTISNDCAERDVVSDVQAGSTTIVGGKDADTFKFGYGSYDVNVTGGAGADVFDFTGSWPHDVWIAETNKIVAGGNITINDLSAKDKIIFSEYTAKHMDAEGEYVNDSADGYAKYSMIFDVSIDDEGKGTADLSKVIFTLKDEKTIANKWNEDLGMPNTSIMLKTEDENGSVLDSKFYVRNEKGKDVQYKINETVINQITEKVVSWLSTSEYDSVGAALADGNKDVLGVFVNAVKPYEDGFGTTDYEGQDILIMA